jgi:hypothetical protein
MMGGFVYIWHDRKHGKFYIGSHWGDPEDGYVCSSRGMLAQWVSRPGHFRRRIIATATDPDELRIEEYRWLRMIGQKPHRHRRYYNRLASHAEPMKRLTLDVPMSLHRRFKVACADHELSMVGETIALIEHRTAKLEAASK